MSTFPHLILLALVIVAVPFCLLFIFLAFVEKAEAARRLRFLGGSAVPRHLLPLSPAEKRALIEVARGNSHKIAADNLGLTRRTVSNQIGVVYLKKRVNNITSAVVVCLRDEDITLDDLLQPNDPTEPAKEPEPETSL